MGADPSLPKAMKITDFVRGALKQRRFAREMHRQGYVECRPAFCQHGIEDAKVCPGGHTLYVKPSPAPGARSKG